MKKICINIMKKIGIYQTIEYIYFALKPKHNTVYFENKWHKRQSDDRNKDWDAKGRNWIENYWLSVDHPHRKHLIDAIERFKPISAFEIGCNCGVNLYMISKKHPDWDLSGTDINVNAIQKGVNYMRMYDIKNVSLYPNKADEVFRIEDKSVDVVFTDAVLIYIAPDKIDEVITEMLRIAKKGIVLVEWDISKIMVTEGHNKDMEYHKGLCRYNYQGLFEKHGIKSENIMIKKITKEMWPDENWSTVGSIIEVTLQ